MESEAVFEQRIVLTPKELNSTEKSSINSLILSKLRDMIENKCSKHGFVLPGTLEILSRSLGRVENGRFTGSFIYQVQARGKVLVPVDGAIIRGTILKKNKMGIYVYYKNAFRVMVPRDFHLGDQSYESLKIGDEIEVELKKSRFQINDNYIISVGILRTDDVAVSAAAPVPDELPELIEEAAQPKRSVVRRITRKPPVSAEVGPVVSTAAEVVEALTLL
jgi:DNA-directed RNA polymerase subunit E'/Rpb7